MRRNITRLITLAAVTLIAACSDSTGPNADVTGSYDLVTLNGSGLPIVVSFDPTSTLRITGGNVTLNSNNTFTSSGSYQETFANGQTTTGTEACDGTYTRNGNSITFTEVTVANTNCGGVYNGTWDGNDTITVAFDATIQAVFRR